ncbi:hypothetical protein VTN00DRAFT_1280 [Thermoascus crustaceus]|uniref:uncharacterized protein n=1 Tax=Thermoascus crustaceus TaxID=5088 RepID=UPI003742D987
MDKIRLPEIDLFRVTLLNVSKRREHGNHKNVASAESLEPQPHRPHRQARANVIPKPRRIRSKGQEMLCRHPLLKRYGPFENPPTQQRCCDGELKEYSTWTQLNPMVTRVDESRATNALGTRHRRTSRIPNTCFSRADLERPGIGEVKVEAAGSMAGDATDVRRRLQPYGVAAGDERRSGQSRARLLCRRTRRAPPWWRFGRALQPEHEARSLLGVSTVRLAVLPAETPAPGGLDHHFPNPVVALSGLGRFTDAASHQSYTVVEPRFGH